MGLGHDIRRIRSNAGLISQGQMAQKFDITFGSFDRRKIKIDNPGYEVVVREVAKKTSSINRITLKTMENYIKMHDTDGKIMEEFKKLRDEKTGENLHKTTFFEIKQWFFETYSDLKDEIKAA